jgi:cardiolipin synthase
MHNSDVKDHKNYEILFSPEKIYSSMLSDIKRAKKEILLETYIYGNDRVGKEFREELTKKAKEGVKVKLLIDAWGSNVRKRFFKSLINAGGEVRFFRQIRYTWKLISENHKRNHRKLLIIDKEISYIGSINITASCLKWEELVIRVQGPLAIHLGSSFNRVWKRFNILKIKRMKRIFYEGLEILHDFPSGKVSFTGRKYSKLISAAKEEILIITPYFLPSRKIRRALKNAVKRGTDVRIILPKSSDVKFLDLIRKRYIRSLIKNGIMIYFYPKIIHSKMLIVDNNFFLVGSSNLDYRSFMHQFELNILGINKDLVKDLKIYFYNNLKKAELLDNHIIGHGGILSKIFHWLMRPIKEYL